VGLDGARGPRGRPGAGLQDLELQPGGGGGHPFPSTIDPQEVLPEALGRWSGWALLEGLRLRGREAEGEFKKGPAGAVTGGWKAVSVAVLAVAKRLEGIWGQSEVVGAELTIITEWGDGGDNTPFKRRPDFGA
jgi:hypothetical protein